MDGSNFEIPDEVAKSVFDELKTHLAQRRRTLRSKAPDGVRREFFGRMLAHYAVCWLMHHTARYRGDAHAPEGRQTLRVAHDAAGAAQANSPADR